MLVQDYILKGHQNFYIGPWNICKSPKYLQQKVLKYAVEHNRFVGQLTETPFSSLEYHETVETQYEVTVTSLLIRIKWYM
jgi:hypothetical protein